MKQQHHAIYVPGILDDIYRAQSLAVAGWRLYGIRGHCHPMPWAGDRETYEEKYNRLLADIDSYLNAGHKVSLVGASAGASAVINAYLERPGKISGLVYLCGKINHPETVSNQTYQANPAFKISVERLQHNLSRLTDNDKSRMLSLYSAADKAVPHRDTIISGVNEQSLPNLRHGRAIMYAITLGSPSLLRFLKQQTH